MMLCSHQCFSLDPSPLLSLKINRTLRRRERGRKEGGKEDGAPVRRSFFLGSVAAGSTGLVGPRGGLEGPLARLGPSVPMSPSPDMSALSQAEV